MTQAIGYFCDRVMDEFGSTCPQRILLTFPTIDAARTAALAAGWALAGSAGGDLCPQHSGRLYRLQLDPPGGVQPGPRPDQVVSSLFQPRQPLEGV